MLTTRALKLFLVLVLLFVFTAGTGYAQILGSTWTRQFGTSDFDAASGVAVDGGNVYVAGSAVGLPGATGSGKLFVAKFDSGGNVLWIRQFAGQNVQGISGVAAGGGNVYVAGTTQGTIECLSQVIYDVLKDPDVFIRKYDADGNVVWTRQFGSSDGDFAFAVVGDGGNVYVVGKTFGSLPGATGSGRLFVAKFDSGGNVLWIRLFGTTDIFDQVRAVAAGGGNVYVAGHTESTLPGQTSSGFVDAFVRKYDADGNVVWTRQFGGPDLDRAFGVGVGSSGNVYVAGETRGLPGQTTGGRLDAFVIKFNAGGNVLWTRQFGTSGGDSASQVAVDVGNVYVAGSTGGTFPGQTSAGLGDVFVRKYDADGNVVWTRQFGSSSRDGPTGIAVDSSGIYVAGLTFGVLPGQTSSGGADAFVVKFALEVTPAELTVELIDDLDNLGLPTSVQKSLIGPLTQASNLLADENPNNDASACGQLSAFISQVDAKQINGQLTAEQANQLKQSANDIRASLGC